jgi:tape measure domain-containing protein
MATNAKIDALNISIQGMVDPSLLRAIHNAESLLKQFNLSAKTNSAVMSRVYNAAFGSMSSNMVKATDQANKLHGAFQRITEIGSGVAIGEMVTRGLEAGLGVIERMGEGLKEMAMHSSELASHFEMQSRGIGNLLRNQPMANLLMGQLQTMANASPFQLTELADTARSLAARGVAPGALLQTTGQIGNIIAGLGGGAGELDRATLAYGEAMSGKTLNTREINQLTELGVPIWAELQKFTGKSVEEIHKLIEKHQIDSQVLNRIFSDLTTGDGLFADAMQHFSETFQGELTTFRDKAGQVERDFGFVVNEWVGDLLKFVNSSGVWNDVHEWMVHLQEMSHSVLTFVNGMNVAFPGFDRFREIFDGFNKWLAGYFSLVDIPNQGTVTVLNAAGEQKITQAIEAMERVLERIQHLFDSVYNLSVRISPLVNLIKAVTDPIDNLIYGKILGLGPPGGPAPPARPFFSPSDLIRNAQDKVNWLQESGGSDSDVEKAKADLIRLEKGQAAAVDVLTQKFTALNDAFPFPIAGMLPGVGGSNMGLTVYGPGVAGDQPGGPTYDRDSYAGIGHIHGVPYKLSAGDAAMHPDYATSHYHIKPGEPYFSDKDHQWHRWRDTSGAKSESNEDIYTPKPQAQINVNYTINSLVDIEHFHRLLREHSDALAQHVRDALGRDDMRSAVV